MAFQRSACQSDEPQPLDVSKAPSSQRHFEGQRDSTPGRVFALNAADTGSIPSTPYYPLIS